MLYEMEDRLIHRMDKGFNELKSEFHSMKSEFHGVKSEVHSMKSEFHEVKSEVHSMKSEFHRVALLVEEQNARNKYVLDGYTQLYELIAQKLQA